VFWFLLVTLVVVVAAVTLVVVGGDDGVALPETQSDRLHDPLPVDRPVGRADVDALRLPMAVRGYRMTDVDEVLGRLGAELAERDARIAELEAAVVGARTSARSGRSLPEEHGGHGREADHGGHSGQMEHGGFGPQGDFGGNDGFGVAGHFGGHGRAVPPDEPHHGGEGRRP
jgi:DivIVA domain-containing protein